MGESINLIYWIEGDYIVELMVEINYFFCDWCSNQMISIDICMIDIIVVMYNMLDGIELYIFLLGYWLLVINVMLCMQLLGVVCNLFYMCGQVVDLCFLGCFVG